VANYLRSLSSQLQSAQIGAPIRIMQSNGGVMSDAAAAVKPSHIIESGPAAGVVGGAYLARQAGFDNLITFDMGGTTAKASMVEAGEPALTTEYEVGAGISLSSRLVKGRGHALKLPVIDIAEVGAGGGSIVRIDSGGALKVGPDSAGAVPGPVCYETGGVDPTVTDANVTLGFINPRALAGGVITLNRDKAIESIQTTAADALQISALDAAHGVYEIANVSMIRAIKAVTTYRGRDPREFAMLAFGGSGPVHAAGIARSLGIRTVIVPPAPGLFSAFGLLTAAPAYRFVQTLFRKVAEVEIEELDSAFTRLRETATESLREEDQDPVLGTWTALADLRYSGQGYELSVNFGNSDEITREGLLQTVRRFHEEHDRTYGHRSDEEPVEIVNIRYLVVFPSNEQPASVSDIASGDAKAIRDAYFGPDHGLLSTPVVGRADIGAQPTPGPIIVDEYDATTVVPPDAHIHRDELNNLILTFEEA
jgi:N-methylhydantoinase A